MKNKLKERYKNLPYYSYWILHGIKLNNNQINIYIAMLEVNDVKKVAERFDKSVLFVVIALEIALVKIKYYKTLYNLEYHSWDELTYYGLSRKQSVIYITAQRSGLVVTSLNYKIPMKLLKIKILWYCHKINKVSKRDKNRV